jgi:hypothetical protein
VVLKVIPQSPVGVSPIEKGRLAEMLPAFFITLSVVEGVGAKS